VFAAWQPSLAASPRSLILPMRPSVVQDDEKEKDRSMKLKEVKKDHRYLSILCIDWLLGHLQTLLIAHLGCLPELRGWLVPAAVVRLSLRSECHPWMLLLSRRDASALSCCALCCIGFCVVC
jgi:hypothetical protein